MDGQFQLQQVTGLPIIESYIYFEAYFLSLRMIAAGKSSLNHNLDVHYLLLLY